ncbi:uncharacterized protein C8Q71DRAFT_370345 [Rhodofomes roseus]|uniref:Uncharacterized protein n=1 Tax=Rhodofomes roseus TaxID=34475 RepID=A0ABQ8K1K1_9APHY|nr:uncharacterized protein C8Q71DRAFT_370345 [Rhodofomes roseus]KAH9830533.1 hypothetical protein C8Q71DRAFT_370345 [Rhodofomes roseus]
MVLYEHDFTVERGTDHRPPTQWSDVYDLKPELVHYLLCSQPFTLVENKPSSLSHHPATQAIQDPACALLRLLPRWMPAYLAYMMRASFAGQYTEFWPQGCRKAAVSTTGDNRLFSTSRWYSTVWGLTQTHPLSSRPLNMPKELTSRAHTSPSPRRHPYSQRLRLLYHRRIELQRSWSRYPLWLVELFDVLGFPEDHVVGPLE